MPTYYIRKVRTKMIKGKKRRVGGYRKIAAKSKIQALKKFHNLSNVKKVGKDKWTIY